MAKDVLITPADGDIQFKNASGTESGKIEQSGDDLIISNAVGDVLIGDGTSDIYVGDGINNVDIIFEQDGSVRGETGAGVTLTLGSNDTTLNITGSGTMHLNGPISSSGLFVDGNINTSGIYQIDGISILNTSTTYTQLKNPEGANGLYLGDSADRSNYYDNNSHVYRTSGGTAELMKLNSTGLGIGVTTPNHKVDIYSNENIPLRIHRPSNANLDRSGAWGIGFSTRGDANISTTDTRAGIFSYYNGNLFLAAANTSIVADPDTYARLTILNTGRVGIGTTTPSQNLHIVGGTGSGTVTKVVIGGEGTGNNESYLYLAEQMSGDNVNFGFSFVADGNSTNNLFIKNHNSSTTGNIAMTVARDTGYVGIGTTSPVYKLHLVGGDFLTATANGGYFQVDESDNSVKFSDNIKAKFGTSSDLEIYHDSSNSYIDDTGTGNLKIRSNRLQIEKYTGETMAEFVSDGETSLWYDNNKKLATTGGGVDVTGFLGVSAGLNLNDGSAASPALFFNNDTNTGIYRVGTDILGITTGGNTRMVVNSAGFVGIGTTSPSSTLNVVGGDIRTDAIGNYRYDTDTNFVTAVGSDPSYMFNGPFTTITHDVFRFLGNQYGSGYLYNDVTQSIYDGSTWTTETLDSQIFSGNTSVAVSVINDAAGEQAVRWEVNNVAYNSARWLVINHTYVAGGVSKEVKVETSGSSGWTTRHISTYTGVAVPYLHHIDNYGGDNRLRITITKGDLNDGKNINVSSIQLLTTRHGDQGKGAQEEHAYIWDKERNIGVGNYAPGAGTLEARLAVKGTTADTSGYATVMRNGSNTSLFSVRNDGRVDIPTGNLVTGQDVTVGSRLYITTRDTNTTSTTALVMNGTEVEQRTLGTAAFSNTGDFAAASHNHDDRYYTETEIGNFFSGTTAITGYSKSNWDAAYTYSQVGHLPLTGGTLTGTLNIGAASTDGAGIHFIYSTSLPEIRIQTGENGASAFSIYNTATSPDSEQFFINNTLSTSHLGNARGALKLETNSGVVLTLNGTATTLAGDLTVSGGNITLSGTGRIQGVDTVSVDTDAANKLYVDNAVSGLVDGSGTANYVPKWSDTDTLTDSVIYDNGTNVGIGTTSPSTKLHIVGSTYSTVGFFTPNSSLGYFTNLSSTAGMLLSSLNGVELVSGGNSTMVLSPTGNVGIGTTSPGALLDVYGADALINNRTIGGGHGAGLTNTSFGYQVYGAAAGSNIDNTVVGYRTLYSANGAIRNTAVGKDALTALTSGDDNVAIGYRTNYSLTTGACNVAIGSCAGFSQTTSWSVLIGKSAGYSNLAAQVVAIGYEALRSANTQAGTIAIGYRALESQTTGAFNMGVGFCALASNTTGASNLAIGQSALVLNVSGSCNIGIGFQALEKNSGNYNIGIGAQAIGCKTSGDRNIGIGYQALRCTTTAQYNNIIGYRAGDAITDAVHNVGIGHEALPSLTTGGYNVAIGSNAGGINNTTNSNSTFVGYNARAGASGNTNEIVIGYSALGNGSNTTTIGNNSTTDTIIPAGDVGIGTTSPSYKLHVAGAIGIDSNIYHNGDADTYIGYPAADTMDFVMGGNPQMRIISNNVNIRDTLSFTYPTNTNQYHGEIVTFGTFYDTNGTIEEGDIIVYVQAGLNRGWFRASANTSTYSIGMLGIAMGTTPSDGILIKGFARNANYTPATAGLPLYLATTQGDVTITAPSSTNNVVRVIGYMLNTTNDEIFFDPDKSWTVV